MLEPAINYKDELNECFHRIWFNPKYKFWVNANYYEDSEISNSTWNHHQFVSVNSLGKVIGYISYQIDRGNDSVYALSIINFSNNVTTFGKDAGTAILDIFKKLNFRKITFSVVIGNPIEHTYDKLMEKYGGRIIGIIKKDVRLIDNQFYDKKLYEIFREDYLNKSVDRDGMSRSEASNVE